MASLRKSGAALRNALYTTVQHTGTMFFRAALFGAREWQHPKIAKDGELSFVHTLERHKDWLRADTIITTLRDPLHVAASWYSRGLTKDRYAEFRASWRLWRSVVYPRAAAVLAFDTDDREARFAKANDALDQNQPMPAWDSPINSESHNSLIHYLLARKDMDGVFSLIDEAQILGVLDDLGDAAPDSYRWWL